MPSQITGKFLKELWGIPAKHVLYSHDGTWFHQLTAFPGALCDSEGYVLFATERAFRECTLLRIKKDVGCPGGIQQISGYVRCDGQPQTTSIPLRNRIASISTYLASFATHESAVRSNFCTTIPASYAGLGLLCVASRIARHITSGRSGARTTAATYATTCFVSVLTAMSCSIMLRSPFSSLRSGISSIRFPKRTSLTTICFTPKQPSQVGSQIRASELKVGSEMAAPEK